METTKHYSFTVDIYEDSTLHRSIPLSVGEVIAITSDNTPFLEWPESTKIYLRDNGSNVQVTCSKNQLTLTINGVSEDLPYRLQPGNTITITPQIALTLSEYTNQESDELNINMDADDFIISTTVVDSETIEAEEVVSPFVTDDLQDMDTSETDEDDQESVDIVVTPTSTLARIDELQRVGCGFCFRTLDPHDSREDFRTFVTYMGSTFHTVCFRQAHPDHIDEAEQAIVPVPDPLPEIVRHGIPLYGGPVTDLMDEPLGISRGTVVLTPETDGADESVMLKNNSDQIIQIARHEGPVWIYIDFGNYQQTSNTMTLQPKQEQLLHIYPHPAIPTWQQSNVDFNDTHHILVVSNLFTPQFALSSLAFIGLLIMHVYVAMIWFGNVLEPVNFLATLVTSALIVGWFAFMMPAKLLWGVFNTLRQVSNTRFIRKIPIIIEGVVDLNQQVWKLFADDRVKNLYSDTTKLLTAAAIGIVVGAMINLAVLVVLTLVVGIITALLGGLGTLIVSILYIGIAYLFAVYVLSLYGVPLHNYMKRIWSFIYKLGHGMWQQSQKPNTSENNDEF